MSECSGGVDEHVLKRICTMFVFSSQFSVFQGKLDYDILGC
jgi:hypothetical protein